MPFKRGLVVQCDGKRTYRTWADALRAVRRIMRRDDETGVLVSPYICPHCAAIHVGGARKGTYLGHPERRFASYRPLRREAARAIREGAHDE